MRFEHFKKYFKKAYYRVSEAENGIIYSKIDEELFFRNLAAVGDSFSWPEISEVETEFTELIKKEILYILISSRMQMVSF